MKYSKRDREKAAIRCALIADYWSRRPCGGNEAYEFAADNLHAYELSMAAYDVANAAYPSIENGTWIAHTWAEAEALIRTGWTP